MTIREIIASKDEETRCMAAEWFNNRWRESNIELKFATIDKAYAEWLYSMVLFDQALGVVGDEFEKRDSEKSYMRFIAQFSKKLTTILTNDTIE